MLKKYFLYMLIVAAMAVIAESEELDSVQSVVHTDNISMRSDSVKEMIGRTHNAAIQNIDIVDEVSQMFEKGKVSGNLRAVYAGYFLEDTGEDIYSTAVGGALKYELAKLKGFNGAVEFSYAKDVSFATSTPNNPELASKEGAYTEMTQAYIDYFMQGFGVRLGRQQFDTPLADSDDVRMVKNTFEAYTVRYEYKGLNFLAGNIQRWQGNDSSDENGSALPGWITAGKKGVNFAGVSYSDMWECNLWYYDFREILDAYYFDGGLEYPLNKKTKLHVMVQYLHESSNENSGYGGDVYGGLFEFVYDGLGVNLSFNYADNKNKRQEPFIGVGGGSFFASMDTASIEIVAKDRKALAFMGGFVYRYKKEFEFLYAYGYFKGSANSVDVDALLSEQDIVLNYTFKNKIVASLIYADVQDRYKTLQETYDFDRLQVSLNYNF